ncbi:MAG: hypothetical protein WC333_10735 [Dehalococcoidia bacterium]|jgi:hypothetical protein
MPKKQKQESENLGVSEKKYETYFNALTNEMYSALHHLKFYDIMQGARNNYQVELNRIWTFWGLTIDAHRDATILALSRMLEQRKKRNDSITLWKFLEFIENNLELFRREVYLERCRSKHGSDDIAMRNYKELTTADINSDRESLEKYRRDIDNVIGWRDKEVAHKDGGFSFSNRKVSEEYPISSKQLTGIVEQIKKILNKYSLAYDSTEHAFNIVGDECIELVLESIRFRQENYIRIMRMDNETQR